MRRTIDIDPKLARLAIGRTDGSCYLCAERSLRGSWKRRKIKPAICPDAALHSSRFVLQLKRFEPDYECGNHIARLGRKNRDGYQFVHRSVSGTGILLDVA